MTLIVGLGNPGKKYEKTRHNIGSRTIEEIAANFQFPIFRFQKISNAQISQKEIFGQKIILAKPKSFVNLSGKTVKSLINFYKTAKSVLVVIHDDIDLPLGKIRIVKNRGAAGHQGVESIIRELGTKNFLRFRIGISPKTGKPRNLKKFVLEKFNREEEKLVREVIKKTAAAVEFFLKEGLEKTMNKFNN